MAKEVIHVITDDIDGSQDAETITFSYQGTDYEIDLAHENEIRLNNALSEFIEHARKVGRSKSAKPSKAGKRTDLDDIREWARKTGHKVSDRGRIAQDIMDAYDNR